MWVARTYRLLTGDEDPINAKKFYDLIHEYQEKSKKVDLIKFFPGVRQGLEALHQKGIKLAIVSTNDREVIQAFLKDHQCEHYFECIIGEKEVSAYKPDPQGLIRALQLMQIERTQAVFVGDSVHDAGAAKNAHVDFIGVLCGFTSKDDLEKFPQLALANTTAEAMQVQLATVNI